MKKSWICRILNSHRWVRVPASEDAYGCKRCGKRYYGGRPPKADFGAFGGGGSGPLGGG